MKKLLILTCLIALALPMVSQAQTTKLQETGTSLILMNSVFTDSKLKDFSGGIKIGTILPLDKDKGLFLRTCYSRFNFGPNNQMSSVEVTALSDWYIGHLWKLYALMGGNAYTGGDNNGTDLIAGIGLSRRIWTEPLSTGIPAGLDLYGEISFTDATGQTIESFAQLNFGVKFNKGN